MDSTKRRHPVYALLKLCYRHGRAQDFRQGGGGTPLKINFRHIHSRSHVLRLIKYVVYTNYDTNQADIFFFRLISIVVGINNIVISLGT